MSVITEIMIDWTNPFSLFTVSKGDTTQLHLPPPPLNVEVGNEYITKLSLEILCHLLKYLPLRDVLLLECQCRKLQQAVNLHLRVRQTLDFTEGRIYGWLPDRLNDSSLLHLIQKCEDLRYIYGFHPRALMKRRTRGLDRLSISGVIDALAHSPKLTGIEISDLALLTAILKYLPRLEVLGLFKNRNGTFPIPSSNKLLISTNPRMTSIHLDGVVVPDLPRMDHVRHLHLNWVKFTQFHPFKDFGAPLLHSFSMVNCVGPLNALKYLPLLTAVTASRWLNQLTLVRVPFLGGLIQHLVQDSWQVHGFLMLQMITLGACKHVLETDMGFLVITAAQSLTHLSIQPSLTKDSLFLSLKMADISLPTIDTLKLGYVHDFPVPGEMPNEELLQHGLVDVTESPCLLTDSGMHVAGEVFSRCRTIDVYNCPHLIYTTAWLGPNSWTNLCHLRLRRCHALRLEDFCRALPLFTSLKHLHLEQMFREPPKGCARVGLSVGTGFGMSSALVSDTVEEPPRDNANRQNPGPAANQNADNVIEPGVNNGNNNAARNQDDNNNDDNVVNNNNDNNNNNNDAENNNNIAMAADQNEPIRNHNEALSGSFNNDLNDIDSVCADEAASQQIIIGPGQNLNSETRQEKLSNTGISDDQISAHERVHATVQPHASHDSDTIYNDGNMPSTSAMSHHNYCLGSNNLNVAANKSEYVSKELMVSGDLTEKYDHNDDTDGNSYKGILAVEDKHSLATSDELCGLTVKDILGNKQKKKRIAESESLTANNLKKARRMEAKNIRVVTTDTKHDVDSVSEEPLDEVDGCLPGFQNVSHNCLPHRAYSPRSMTRANDMEKPVSCFGVDLTDDVDMGVADDRQELETELRDNMNVVNLCLSTEDCGESRTHLGLSYTEKACTQPSSLQLDSDIDSPIFSSQTSRSSSYDSWSHYSETDSGICSSQEIMPTQSSNPDTDSCELSSSRSFGFDIVESDNTFTGSGYSADETSESVMASGMKSSTVKSSSVLKQESDDGIVEDISSADGNTKTLSSNDHDCAVGVASQTSSGVNVKSCDTNSCNNNLDPISYRTRNFTQIYVPSTDVYRTMESDHVITNGVPLVKSTSAPLWSDSNALAAESDQSVDVVVFPQTPLGESQAAMELTKSKSRRSNKGKALAGKKMAVIKGKKYLSEKVRTDCLSPVNEKADDMKSLCDKNKHLPEMIDKSCQAVSEEIREATKRVRDDPDAPCPDDVISLVGVANVTTADRESNATRSTGKQRQKTRHTKQRAEKIKQNIGARNLRRSGQCDQVTSTSDPVNEDDHVQVLHICSPSLTTLTLHMVGVTDIIIDAPVRKLKGTACRVLRRVDLDKAGYVNNVSFAQCANLQETSLIAQVCKTTREDESCVVYLRPMHSLDVPCVEREMFHSAGHMHHMCLITDDSSNPGDTLQIRNAITSWPELFRYVNLSMLHFTNILPVQCTKLRQRDTFSDKYPWGRHIYSASKRNPDGSDWEIMTDLPFLRKQLEDGTYANATLSSLDRKFHLGPTEGHNWSDKFLETLDEQAAEVAESGQKLYTNSIIVYVNTCDLNGKPTDDFYL